MLKWIIILCLTSYAALAQAHQPDISTTMLLEREDGQWLLQIRASLSAFQYEIKANYPDSTYSSPEEFQQLVINHVNQHLFLQFNQKDTLIFQNPYVKLGHETNVVFEVLGVPKVIESLQITHSSFKDIHRNQSAFITLKKGFSKEQFVLNGENEHTLNLVANNSKFILSSEDASVSSSPSYWLLLAGLIVMIGGSLFYSRLRPR